MSSKVAPAPPPLEPPIFQKPVATTPPLTMYDPTYVTRKSQVQVAEQILTLQSGRQLAYFTEGNRDDPAVLCLHSLGQSKYEWLFPSPVAGIFLIAVDRQGHGNSSPYADDNSSFADGVQEYKELMDALNISKFYVTGSSMGGVWSLILAAALPDRVLGCATLSALCDPWHATVTPTQRRSFGPPGAGSFFLGITGKGCKSGLKRSMLLSMTSSFYKPDKSKDPGFAAYYKYCVKTNKCATLAAMNADLFFASSFCDAYLHGVNSKRTFLVEQLRHWNTNGWPYDTATIKCPTFLYQGARDEETSVPNAEQNHKIIPGSELILLPEHGHVTLIREAQKIVTALVQGTKAQIS